MSRFYSHFSHVWTTNRVYGGEIDTENKGDNGRAAGI